MTVLTELLAVTWAKTREAASQSELHRHFSTHRLQRRHIHTDHKSFKHGAPSYNITTLWVRWPEHLYEEESVNMSQMDVKRKTCDIRNWKNIYFSTYPPPTLIHLSHRFTSASKPAAYKSFDCYLSHFRTSVSTLRHQRNLCHTVVNRFTRQTLPTVNRKNFFMNILCIESFCPQKNVQQNAALR
jgi:hypothetical protein